MAKTPTTKKPGKSPKSKAHRPDVQPIGPALAELLNPAINRGDAGMGSGTGLQPPPDNSWDRRAGGEAAAHRARASTRGTSEVVAKRDALPYRNMTRNVVAGQGGGSARPRQRFGHPRSRPGARAPGRLLEEAPQANYGTSATIPTLDPELARQLGLPPPRTKTRRSPARRATRWRRSALRRRPTRWKR